MEQKFRNLKAQKKYDEIIENSFQLNPDTCKSAEVAHIIGKAFEKKNAFSQSKDWYLCSYKLSPSDEALGMYVGVCLAYGDYKAAEQGLNLAEDQYGYYCKAGRYELAFRTNQGVEEEMEKLKELLDVQDEESYMLRLANLLVLDDREKEAGRICKKMGRLFINGPAVDYAEALLDAIKAGDGRSYVTANPWITDNIFKHVTFDPAAKPMEDKRIEKKAAAPQEEVVRMPQLNTQPAASVQPAAQPEEPKKSGITEGIAATIAKLNEMSPLKKDEKKEKEKQDPAEKIQPIIEASLKDIVGMKEVKMTLNYIYNMLEMGKKRNGAAQILKNNIRIYGPDGSGKTTAASAAVGVLAKIGVIGDDTPVVTDYFSLAGASVQETGENIQKLFESADDKCILIENLHEFNDNTGFDALDQLVRAYQAAEERIPLIITGRKAEIEEIFTQKKKFAELFNLPPALLGEYTKEELVEIAYKIAEDKSLIINDEAKEILVGKLENLSQQNDFTYAHDIEQLINNAYLHQVSRLAQMRRLRNNDILYVLTAEDFGDAEKVETVEELLEQLNSMTGLAGVKAEVQKIVNQVKINKLREKSMGEGTGHGSLHLVFLGNAGTGKTTVARIIGKIYKRLGILPGGQMIECTRKDLVAEFVGGTAQKVAAKVKEAMGGILFIDEAYTLCKDMNDTFGKEAIDGLVADIENYRDKLMVILAGYEEDMNKFMDQNQGLRSRMAKNILFEDYSTEEMVEIFKYNVKGKGMHLEVGLEESVFQLLDTRRKIRDFGNARGVRNVFEEILLNQSERLSKGDPALLSKNDFCIIRKADVEASMGAKSKGKTLQELLEELNALTGLDSVKRRVNEIVDAVMVNKQMKELGLEEQNFGTLHMVFKGNAGTGKTTVARIIGEIFKQLGVLSGGQLVECDRSDLVGTYVGETAPKTKAKIREAMGGVLFIDEAYMLARDTFGKEAIDTLVADAENKRSGFMIIIAGYPAEMDDFLQQNQGLASRFPYEIIFEDYSADELLKIFKNMVKGKQLYLSDDLDEKVKGLLAAKSKEKDFGNARGVRNVLDKIINRKNVRIADMLRASCEMNKEDMRTILEEDLGLDETAAQDGKSVDELLAQLNALTGLKAVKEKINKIVATVQVNKTMKELGLPAPKMGTLHMVFKGNAGTGKTTVARLLGEIYKGLGVLSSGHFVECDRSKLVGTYVGQTAPITKAKVQEAMGGILFIDEAYSLAKGGEHDYGKEAIDTLVADIENYRDDLMVVLAGYSDDMDIFLEQNQGLRSRFPNEIIFEDYSPAELVMIFRNNITSRGLILSEGLDEDILRLVERVSCEKDFGNARGIRNLVDKIVEQRSLRIAQMIQNGSKPTVEDIQTVIAEDITIF